MTVLVTGAGGFLGSHLAGSLLRSGCDDLRLQVRRELPASMSAELRALNPAARIEVVSANLVRRESLPELVAGVDVIVHAAAGTRGAAADMFLNSVVGTRNLLEAAAGAGCRRIALVSSFSVYNTAGLRSGATLDESRPMEATGLEKDAYAYTKVQQEKLFREYQQRYGFAWVIARPGVIYGPGGGGISTRVGIRFGNVLLFIGGSCLLPLTYVDNCADAVALVALRAPSGTIVNVVDSELPTCRQYLAEYRRSVSPISAFPLPKSVALLGAKCLAAYHRRSRGQLPSTPTPYAVRSLYKKLRYSNATLMRLGWRQRVSTTAGLGATFAALREQHDAVAR